LAPATPTSYSATDEHFGYTALENNQNAPYSVAAIEFRLLGFEYTQLKRLGDVAIYRQSKKGLPDGYEVVRIQKHEAFSAFGKDFPAGESYPSSQQWGSDGWTYRTLEDAEQKFQELSRRGSHRVGTRGSEPGGRKLPPSFNTDGQEIATDGPKTDQQKAEQRESESAQTRG